MWISLMVVYKQQRARQVNGVMFERRIHSGFEGATTKDQQGELFGIHNLFQYNPEGNVTLNVSALQIATDM